ncbi:hypothetical protein Bca101_049081 [Brassica carinata]
MDLVDQFKTSLPNDSLALTNNDSTQWSVGTATSVRAKFFVLNEKRIIREIILTIIQFSHYFDDGMFLMDFAFFIENVTS